MGKVYIGQDFRLTLTGGIDITGGSAKMRYLKPGTSAYTEVAVTIQTPATATCYHDFAPADVDAVGTWKFWLWLTTSDAKVYPGETFTLNIYAEGN